MGFPESCPRRGAGWHVRDELIGERASGFENCAFRCLRCGIGYSNSRAPEARRLITQEPAANAPVQVRGPEFVLEHAANVRNRAKKRQAFCSETSEDAVVWTIVSALRQFERLEALADLPQPSDQPDLLLWGASDDGAAGQELAEALRRVCTDLGEAASSLSEPDVVLSVEGHLVFIEAKYGSPNDEQPNSPGFAKYLRNPALFTASSSDVAGTGLVVAQDERCDNHGG